MVKKFAYERSGACDGCPRTFTETVGKGHGRIETRRCWRSTTRATDSMSIPTRRDPASAAWSWSRRNSAGRTARPPRLAASSPVCRLGMRVYRRPCAVTGGTLWVRELTALGSGAFREDESRIHTGHANRNRALLRHLALHLLRRDRQAQGGLAARRKRTRWYHPGQSHSKLTGP